MPILVLLYLAITISLALFLFHRMYLCYAYMRSSTPEPPQSSANPFKPYVTVQLPIYNEINVAERLVAACLNLDYPPEKLQIQILDDSTDETSKLVQKAIEMHAAMEIDVQHICRDHRQGFKAGALAEGLKEARGEFIAIFDADFIPPPNFLNQALGPFQNQSRLGMVQSRWTFINPNHSLLTKAQEMMLNAHFSLEHQARQCRSLFINFNGTAGIWRKETLLDAGNWQADTITEDLDISYRAQLKGWKFLYVPQVEVPSELPTDILGLKTQQFRWSKGASQTARKLLPSIWASSSSKAQKIEAFFHLAGNASYLLLILFFLSFPPMLKHYPDWASRITSQFAPWVAITLGGMTSFFLLPHLKTRGPAAAMRRLIYLLPTLGIGSGLSINNGFAFIQGLWTKGGSFERTPKIGHQKNFVHYPTRSHGIVLLEALFFLYLLYWIPFIVGLNRWAIFIPFFLCITGQGYVLAFSLLESLKKITIRTGTKSMNEAIRPSIQSPVFK